MEKGLLVGVVRRHRIRGKQWHVVKVCEGKDLVILNNVILIV